MSHGVEPPVDTSDIDSVLVRLGNVIDEAAVSGSRLGYFAAMYLQVTREVKLGVVSGRFDDGGRMSRFDRLFAEHYFRALEAAKQREAPPLAWQLAFDAARRPCPLVLQHLLLGMNAHINLDLAITVTELAAGGSLQPIRDDYDRINAILSELIDRIQAALVPVSPWLGLLDRVGGETDEAIVEFSIETARAGAWRFAERLAKAPNHERPALIRERDAKVAAVGRRILRPSLPLRAITHAIRLRESNDPLRILAALS